VGALLHAAIQFTRAIALSSWAPTRDAPTIWMIPWIWLGITTKISHKPLQKISVNHTNPPIGEIGGTRGRSLCSLVIILKEDENIMDVPLLPPA